MVDSRATPDGTAIRRRRACEHCERRFSTLEELELLDLTVVKRDGRREQYNREKMMRGLRRALEKRSFTESDFRALVQQIERDIQKEAPNEITSAELGELVMARLKAFDKVAYIRFASVYRSFEDVETFERELRGLLRRPSGVKKNRSSTRTKK